MIPTSQIVLNSVVSFDLYPAALLGTGFKNAKVLAIVDADTTRYFGVDPVAQHVNVYPTLPSGTPNKYDGYPWIKLKLASGETTCIGLPWIIDGSYQVISQSSLRFTITDVAPEDQETILQALSANGFTAVNVEVIS